jgi:Glycosyltransferase family 87
MLGFGIALVAAIGLAYGIVFWFTSGAFPGDSLTYYLAGLRLNSGHALYDLRPDDVWLYGRPEYPLYGPPLVAVMWRPLAAMPGGWGIIVWVIAMAFAALTAVFYLLLGTRGWAGLLMIPLIPSLTLLIGTGNVDALVLAGSIAVWSLTAQRRWRAAGILVGVLASLKLSPAILLIWLIATRRWEAVRWTIATGLILAVVVVVGTEPGIWFRYLRVMTDLSQTGNSSALGLLVVGVIAIVAVGSRPSLSFAISAILMPLGSPVAAGHTASLLLAAVAPWVRPLTAAPTEASSIQDPTRRQIEPVSPTTT